MAKASRPTALGWTADQKEAAGRARLVEASATFSHSGYEIIKAALVERFGKPTSDGSRQLASVAGKEEVVSWFLNSEGVTIFLTGGKEREVLGKLTYTSNALQMQEFRIRNEYIEAAGKAGAKDL